MAVSVREKGTRRVNIFRPKKKVDFVVQGVEFFLLQEVPVSFQNIKKEFSSNPDAKILITVGYFYSLNNAKMTARQMNQGKHPFSEYFPRDRYFFIFGDYEESFEVLVGKRPHIPPGWQKFVEMPTWYN